MDRTILGADRGPRYLPIFINVTLASILILWSGDALLAAAVGGVTLAVGAATGAKTALQWTLSMAPLNLLGVLQAWLPGLVGLVLGSAGIILIVQNPGDRALRLVGIVLFALQAALVAASGLGMGGAQRSR